MKQQLSLDLLTSSDLEFANSLRESVGWNQTIADWQCFLDYEPNGCFLATWNGTRVGTATTACYGNALAWIGMLLVHPACRHRGVGKALLARCLAYLSERAICCIKLDATPAGQDLYKQLGFEQEWSLSRWEIRVLDRPHGLIFHTMRSGNGSDLEAVAEFDEHGFGVSRKKMLELLFKRSTRSSICLAENGRVEGYGILREGALASYLGPVVATSPRIASTLIESLLFYGTKETIYWDIPDPNSAAISLAKTLGFKPQRALFRMFRGSNKNPGNPQFQFAIADPATG